MLLFTATTLLLSSATATAVGWRDDLPWDALAVDLSPTASLVDTSPRQYIDECSPEFNQPVFEDISPEGVARFISDGSRSNWGLIDQPSGLCLNGFMCAFG